MKKLEVIQMMENHKDPLKCCEMNGWSLQLWALLVILLLVSLVLGILTLLTRGLKALKVLQLPVDKAMKDRL
jgi:hypothetical protein